MNRNSEIIQTSLLSNYDYNTWEEFQQSLKLEDMPKIISDLKSLESLNIIKVDFFVEGVIQIDRDAVIDESWNTRNLKWIWVILDGEQYDFCKGCLTAYIPEYFSLEELSDPKVSSVQSDRYIALRESK